MKKQPKHISVVSPKVAWMTVVGIAAGMLLKAAYNKIKRYELAGKVILITGGSRGLGLEMARVSASKGAKVVICARTELQLKRAETELQASGAKVLAVLTDLRDPDQASQLISTVQEHFGGIDVLINNAGVMEVGPENVMDISDYQNVMSSNLWSALHTIKAVIPYFRNTGQGRIVNICSIGGRIAVPHMLPYCVSKFALVGLSEGLTSELKKDNIRVTTVIPNLMRTGSPRNVSVKGDHSAEYAWFKIADSVPCLSQNSTQAAKQIITALENGERQVILTLTAKFVSVVNGVAPGVVTWIAGLANQFLPESSNTETKKGYESESATTSGGIAALTDTAAEHNNEL